MCLYPIQIYVKRKQLPPYDKLIEVGGMFDLPIDYREKVTVSCGKCLECLRQKSIEWAFRIMDEASCHSENCFITLTYNNDFLPTDEFGEHSVSRREVQLFMKRFRKAIAPVKIRFFACGEYGAQYGRPHYHLIIFGWFPSDAYFWQNDGKTKLYRSPLLEKVWKFGFSSVGKVSYDSALYCAKYMNKAQFDKRVMKRGDIDHIYSYPTRPFVQMSNRPGIGYDCVYRCDLKYDRIYRDGKSTKIPRYYLKVMERDGIFLEQFKTLRQAQGEAVARVTDLEVKRKKYRETFNKKLVKHNRV